MQFTAITAFTSISTTYSAYHYFRPSMPKLYALECIFILFECLIGWTLMYRTGLSQDKRLL